MLRRSLLDPVAILILTLGASDARAHGLGVGWKARDGRIHLAAFFDDDSAPRGALVWVRNASQETVAEAKTDVHGKWSFPTPPPGKYEVTVDAGAGHRVTRKLIVRDTGADDGPPEVPDDPGHQHTAFPPRSGVVVEGGDERGEFTQSPWWRIAIGLGVIAVLSVAYLTARRLGRNK